MWDAKVRQYRKARGLSQEKLADIFDVDVRTVRRWEGGVTKPCAVVRSEILTGVNETVFTPEVSVFRDLVETSTSDVMLLTADLRVIYASNSQRQWMFETYGVDCVDVEWARYMSPHTHSMLDVHGGLRSLVSNGLAHVESVYHLPKGANGNLVQRTKSVKHTVLRIAGYGVLHLSCATPIGTGATITQPRISWLCA
jgi:transcriptional regulator with XRE-family HTH domain